MRRVLLGAGAAVVVLGGVGLAVFEPWQLWVDTRVDEPIPSVPAPASTSESPGGDGRSDRSAGTPTSAAAQPVVLAEGNLVTHEHDTQGVVRVLELADGSRFVRLEGLDTSSGPDLEVWLSDQPVIEGTDGWHVFDDGEYVDLGDLKANHGNQNYELPADVDLDDYRSVSIWCDRFNVSFGAAELA